MWVSEKRALQTDATASVKVLRWEYSWHVQKAARRSIWPENREGGDRG